MEKKQVGRPKSENPKTNIVRIRLDDSDIKQLEELKKLFGKSKSEIIRSAIYKYYVNAPTFEITEEQAIDKLHETGWILNHDKEMTTRPHGKWILHKDYDESCKYGCNQCGNLNNIPSKFCPNCGVKMAVIPMTNTGTSIAYDIGGHIYGVMGGDKIMAEFEKDSRGEA